jgi:hypothetical protein
VCKDPGDCQMGLFAQARLARRLFFAKLEKEVVNRYLREQKQ